MPKLLTWREDWSLDIDPLDADHRALIGRLADICLHYCPQAGVGGGLRPMPWLSGACAPATERVPTLIDSLSCLGMEAAAHFRREEDFMRAIGYERLSEHEAEHARLLADYRAMLEEWRRRDLRVFDEGVQEAVREWLLNHIAGSDRSFAASYFRACGLDSPPPRGHTPIGVRRIPFRSAPGHTAQAFAARDGRDSARLQHKP